MFSTILKYCFPLLLLLLPSQYALASFDDIQLYWHWYLMVLALVAAVGAFFCIKRKPDLENTGIKILVWGVYFWVIMFAELTLLALLYQIST